MQSMNVVALIGNLTKDPEVRHTASGTAVGTLRIAVNGSTKDPSGNWVDRPDYFNVTVWDKQAENCAQYLSKGSKIGVTGRLRFDEWQADDGTKRSKVEVVADRVQFLNTREDGGGRSDAPEYERSQASSAPDDDIPF